MKEQIVGGCLRCGWTAKYPSKELPTRKAAVTALKKHDCGISVDSDAMMLRAIRAMGGRQ